MRPSLLLQMTFVAAIGWVGGVMSAPHSRPAELTWSALSSARSATNSVLGKMHVGGFGDCTIKGNVSYNRGQLIYHVVGQRDYGRTIITPSRGERWFCSEEEARAAGWRKAGR